MKKKYPDHSSKKASRLFKPWGKDKKKPDIVCDSPPLKENMPPESKSREKPSSPKPFPTRKPQAASMPPSSRRSEIITSPASVKATNYPAKPRPLGTKQVANQPISIPIKQSIEKIRNVTNKIKGPSSTPPQVESTVNEQQQSPEKKIEINVEEITSTETPLFTEIELPKESSDVTLETLIEEPSEVTTETHTNEPSSKVILETHTNEPSSEVTLRTPTEEPSEIAVEPYINQSTISDTLSDIRYIKIWSLDSETVDLSGKSTEELFSEAMDLYRLGLAGENKAISQAFKLLISVLENDRQNVLAEAYLGSVICLMGRDAQDPNERFKFAIQGLKILDKTISREPDNLEIRGLRAFVCAKLPELYFHRSDTAVEDFSFLASRYEEDKSLFNDEFYYQILFELALAYKRLDKSSEAESTCRKLLNLTSDSKYKVLMKQEGLLKSDLPRWQKQLERKSNVKNEWSKLRDEEKLQEGITLHSRAVENDLLAAEKAYEIFKQAHRHNPNDPLIKAYYADCLSLLGQSASDTSTMFRHATHAIKTLDQAVNASPDDITIRLLRGNNSYRLPEAFFRRTLTAIRDFEYLAERFSKDPTILPEETYWKILYDLGDAYERLEMISDAKVIWRRLSECGDTPYKKFVDQLLNEGSSESTTLDANYAPEELLQEGIQYHELALTGNKKAGAKAYEILLKAYDADVTNALAQGYLGSSMAIMGQSCTDPTEMYRDFFKGIDHLRKAIANEPYNYTLHLLLAQVLYRYSPSFYHGNEKAIKEFKFLKLAYEKNNKVFSEEVYLQILYDLGVCYERSGDIEKAQKNWEKLSKLTADPKPYKLVKFDQEGEIDMDKDKDKDKERIRNKFKEIAEDIAQERVKEREGRKERKTSKDHASSSEKPRRKRKNHEKGPLAPVISETTKHKRKKHSKDNSTLVETKTSRSRRKKREKETSYPVTSETTHRRRKDHEESTSGKLDKEEKKLRREEKEKARAEAIEKAKNRATQAKNKDGESSK